MRNAAKALMHWLSVLVVLPLIAIDALGRPLWADGLFSACSQLLSLLPGKTGSYLRVAFYRFAMQSCSRDCFIGFATVFSQRRTCIGPGVYIGPQCNIGSCRVGKDTLIASGVHIMSGTLQHEFSDLDTPIRDQGGRFDMITIGEDCWIGNAALVMAPIGNNSVVGAGSVVNKPIEPLSVAVGNPARILRSRVPKGSPPA